MDFENILNIGVEKEIINKQQKEELINIYNRNHNKEQSVSTVVKVLYYIGGLLMLIAMIALMSHTVQNTTYALILGLGSIYAGVFFFVGEYLWKKNEKFPAGILYFLFITAFAFIVMDIEKMTGFFPHFSDMDKFSNYWDMCRFPIMVLSILTIIANSILQKYRPLSLLAVPTIFCSYSIFMVIIGWIYGCEYVTGKIRDNSNLIFSIGLIIVGFIKDRFTKVDYSKWMYFFGSIMFFFSVFFILNCIKLWETELICFVLSFLYIGIGLIIQRKAFSIIGIFGVIEYFLYLEFKHIEHSTTLLSSIVILTGLIVLYIGVLYSKNIDKIVNFVESILPPKIKTYLPRNRIKINNKT